MWWTRTYLVLLVVRLYLALQPSYIHPDENFQGPEVISGMSPKPFGYSSSTNLFSSTSSTSSSPPPPPPPPLLFFSLPIVTNFLPSTAISSELQGENVNAFTQVMDKHLNPRVVFCLCVPY